MYTVIIPVYNGKKYFEQALNSAIQALTKGDEIIVVEDGSDDGGIESVVKRYSKQVKIRYFYKSNGGVGSALNLGIEKAENPIFAWLSHDDMYLPNRFDADRRLRSLIPKIVTLTDFYIYSELNGSLRYVNATKKVGSRQKVKLLGSRFLNGNCLSIPISLLKSLGGFDESLRHVQDYDMWCKVLTRESLIAIPESTALLRVHADQHSKRMPAEAQKEYVALVKKNLTAFDLINPQNFVELFKIFNSLY